MGASQLSNESFRNKVEAQYYNRYASGSSINGEVPNTGFRKGTSAAPEFILETDRSGQIVESPAITLDGTANDIITLNYEPTDISLNGVDVTASWTIADIGGGQWTIRPNASTQVYNLVINGSKNYPCSTGDGDGLYDVSSNGDHAEVVGAWTSQDAFHQSYYHGCYKKTASSFNGSSAIVYGDVIDFSSIDQLTVVFLFQSTSNTGAFVSKYKTSPTSDRSFLISLSNGSIRGTYSSNGTTGTSVSIDMVTDNSFNDGLIHKVAVVFDGTLSVGSKLKIYVDDVEESASVINSRNGDIATLHDSAVDIIAGASRLGSVSFESQLAGEMSYIGIDRSAFTLAQIKDYRSQSYDLEREDNLTDSATTHGTVTEQEFEFPLVPFQDDSFLFGYIKTRSWNGFSKFRFPDIPAIPVSLRGLTFTKSELEAEALINGNLYIGSDGKILVTNSSLSALEETRL